MKDIVYKMTHEELAEYRALEAQLVALNSGSVSLDFDVAVKIIEEHRAFWTRIHEEHQLDVEEFHVFDAVTGTVSVDKTE